MVLYDNIVDFIDNINYSGLINHIRSYTWDETIKEGIHSIVEDSIRLDCFLNIWADEYNLSCSARFQKYHFVHPIIVYGYDNEKAVFNTWFFDILKGYRAVEINQEDFENAIENVHQHYLEGGRNDETLSKTVMVFKVSDTIPSLPFNLQVFISQLKDYLYSQNNDLLKWYTLSRPQLYDSNNIVYGMQVYLNLINMARRDELNYKTLHDFVMHKMQLLIRFRYIQDHYETNNDYNNCVIEMRKVWELLEHIRLLNIKYQIQDNDFPAILCHKPEYLLKLASVLLEAYEIEKRTIPELYKQLTSLSYPKEYLEKKNIIQFDMSVGKLKKNYFEFDLNEGPKCIYRIDIVRKDRYEYIADQEKIILDDETVYYVETDTPDHSPVRTVNFKAHLVNNIKFYTNTEKLRFELILFLLHRQEDVNKDRTLYFNQGNSAWYRFNEIENVRYGDYMEFDITGRDPNMTHDDIGVNADYIKYIQIRMETNDSSDSAQLFFTTVESPILSEYKSICFHIDPNDKMKVYTLDMSNHPAWKGWIQSIRFDPVNYMINQQREVERTICKLEYIRFTKDRPEHEN